MQLIYGGKTERSTRRYNFPNNFSLSANLKHFSRTNESLRLIDEITVPHTQSERTVLQLQICHPALLIIVVFSGQMTPALCFKSYEKQCGKCLNTVFFLVRMRENTDQKKLLIWTLFMQWEVPFSTCSSKFDKFISTTRFNS